MFQIKSKYKTCFKYLALGAAATIASGCSNSIGEKKVPTASSEDFYFASDILHTLECELNESVELAKRIDPRFAKQSVAVTLTLSMTEAKTVGGNATLVVPVGTSSLSIGSGYTPSITNVRLMEVKQSYTTSDLESCEKNHDRSKSGERNPRRIEGGLGLVEWVGELASIMKSVGEDPSASSYTVSFQVKNSLNGAPVLSVSDDKVGATGSSSRTIKHQLAVTVKSFEKSETKRQSELRTFEIQENFLQRM